MGEKMKKESRTKQKEIKGKKNTKKQNIEMKQQNSIVSADEMKNLFKIVLIVTAIFLIFYGITTLIADKNNQKESLNSTDVTIQYDEILIGTLFEQSNSEYYVLVTTEEDKNISNYLNLISSYKTKENAKKVYTSNLDNGFNKSYKAEETIISNKLEELKLSNTTLLKIKDKTIIESYKNSEEITNHLNTLIK